jgi:arylsulfatase A-like enzyme
MKHILTLLASLALACCSAQAGPPPNILFAIADDWGVHAGAYGTPWVKTPALDRLAREGLLFRNAFTPTAKCAPSRASVLTGRHPWQNEEAGNHMAAFPPKFKSWPEVLMDTPTSGDGFYEKFIRGEKVNASWVSPTDFEKQPFRP